MTSHINHRSPLIPSVLPPVALLLLGMVFATPEVLAQDAKPHETTVGMRVRIDELPLPGTQLRAKPVQDPQTATLILRVRNVFPHGSGFRYNFEVTPLVAGRIDLREHLEREDGSKTDDLPEIPVLVRAELPAGKLKPNELRPEQPEQVGGYRAWQIIAAVVWVLGLLAILFVRKKKHVDHAVQKDMGPRTLADRLRPLVEGARSGDLDDTRRAELERLLLAYWRQRRALQGEKIGAAIIALRKDPEASPLFLKLEEWLHQPQSTRTTAEERHEEVEVDADIVALLEPYRNAPALEQETA